MIDDGDCGAMTRPGLEPGPPRWEASDYPLELWSGLFLSYSISVEQIMKSSFYYDTNCFAV
jgi:hypothetical protein